ncbi:MAG: sugar phosphate isomerase/epimerase [Planctomycetota bacterium]
MNMLLWTDFVTEAHFPVFTALKQAGFDGVEIPLGRGDVAHYANVKKELDQVGLRATAVTSMTAESNPVSPDASVRRAASARMKWAIDMCVTLGAEVLTGPFHSAYKQFSGRGPTADEKSWCAEVMREAAEVAASRGVRLATEFLNRFECYVLTTAADASALVDAVDHASFGINYDTHHAHIEERDPRASILGCGKRITHVHISENDRGTPGHGQVRWQETFEALHAIGYDGWLTIESFSRASPEFAAAIHIWRDFFPSKDEVYREGGAFIRRMWDATV